MPAYEYECGECGDVRTHIQVPYEERDNARICELCGGAVFRLMSAPAVGKPAYQMQAVVTDRNERKVGHMKGHFGKDAKRKRK